MALSMLDEAQRTELMDRLGYHNLVSNIGIPWGIHFKLQIALNIDQEQVWLNVVILKCNTGVEATAVTCNGPILQVASGSERVCAWH